MCNHAYSIYGGTCFVDAPALICCSISFSQRRIVHVSSGSGSLHHLSKTQQDKVLDSDLTADALSALMKQFVMYAWYYGMYYCRHKCHSIMGQVPMALLGKHPYTM